MIKIAIGNCGWDFYLDQYNHIMAVPKSENGCDVCCFGGIDFFTKYIADNNMELTEDGQKMMKIINKIKGNSAVRIGYLLKKDGINVYELLAEVQS